jgi:hypothetical protein
VADFAPPAVAFVRPPGDGDREPGGLFAAEQERRPVEEDPDAAARAEELEAAEDLQPVDALFTAETVERLLEADADAVRRQVAEVPDDQEQQPAFELDVEDDVRLARRVAVLVLRDGSGHGRSFRTRAVSCKYASRCQARARNCDVFVTEA